MTRNRVLVLALLLIVPAHAWCDDHYYMIIFGIQDRLNRFTTAHSVGVFVLAHQNCAEPGPYPICVKVISWLPACGKVRLLKKAEMGRNHSLEESLAEPTADGRLITQWGPVEIQQELFCRAAQRSEDLDENRLLYKAYDEFCKTREKLIASNCEHAILDIDTDHGFIRTGIAHGNRGSHAVAKHLARCWSMGPLERCDLDWLEDCLGLHRFPIRKGKW